MTLIVHPDARDTADIAAFLKCASHNQERFLI
jgi:hypothetical protein